MQLPNRHALADRPTQARATRPRVRGQSLAEFALMLPVLLLIVLAGLDFARLFYSWITLTNAARNGASYAALHAEAWTPTADDVVLQQYQDLVHSDGLNATCPLPATVPAPTFPAGKDLGDPARVSLTCQFRLVSYLGIVLGNPLSLGSSAEFEIRVGKVP